MVEFYQERNMDMFKCAIIPGLSLRYLFSTLYKDTGCYFSRIDEKNKNLYYKMKQNIVGGPSIVFHRYHDQLNTYIRGGPKLCQKVVGFDANAMYLWALMQDMPTRVFVRRNSEDNFKAKQAQKYGIMATEWLDWKARSDGVNIIHKFNGTEKRVGTRNIPVDGFSPENNTVYQFHGCYWHGHNCLIYQKDFNEVRNCSSAELRANTEEIASYICEQGYN